MRPPKGIDFCRFTALSRLYLLWLFSRSPSFHPHFFPFSLLFSFCSFFPLYFYLAHTQTHTNVFMILLCLHPFFVLHFIRSFAPFAPSGTLVMPACFIALYSISKPPASLHSSIPPHTLCSQLHLSPLSLCTVFFLLPLSLPLSPVFTPSICLITRSSPLFSRCLSSPLLFYFLFPTPPLCLRLRRQVLSLPPLLRLSLCTGSCPQPTAWLTNGLSLQRHDVTISRPLYLTSYSYFIAVISADCCWRGDTPPDKHTLRCNSSLFLRFHITHRHSD